MRRFLPLAPLLALLSALPATADPAARWASALSADALEQVVLPRLDVRSLREDDERRVRAGRMAHYAHAIPLGLDPGSHGVWERLEDGQLLWRLRLTSPGARSLSFAFAPYRMPEGGRLFLYSPDLEHALGPFTADDVEPHGELWTPPLLTDDVVLEVSVPEAAARHLELGLASVQHGYAGFGETPPKAGVCNLEVACSPSETWNDPARSVALLTIGGVRFCTGFLVNNTAFDLRPLMITAQHCGIRADEAPSVVAIWNHQSPSCGEQPSAEAETLRHFQTGATLRAAHPESDFVLLELDDVPDPAFGVYYAGWDRGEADPERTVVVHHPNTDAKRIAFDFDAATTTSHLRASGPGDGSHLRVGGWELGTTEGGSSGAPLFNQDGRVIGQLHGGYAACGNRQADWFGRLAFSWSGGGRPGTRLSDWLDPLDTGAWVLDALDTRELALEAPAGGSPQWIP